MLKSISSSLKSSNVQNTARILITSKQDTINHQSVRYARNIKPWKNGPIDLWKQHIYDYEYRKGRAKKVLKINLPDFHKNRNKDEFNMTPDEIRSDLKEKGIVPNRKWVEKPIYVGDTSKTIDSYVPPEGDGIASVVSKEGAGQKIDSVKGKGKKLWHVRKMRNYLEGFDPEEWAVNEGLNIYIRAHEALADGNENELYTLVTDSCLPKMLFNAELKTIKWKYLKSIDLPRVVNLKVEEDSGQAFGQLTVRFHSQQILAIYDRFGRLVSGSEAVIKDVLDYIVFENKISSINGIWRIHDKIVPDWLKKQEYSIETVVKSVNQIAQD